MGNLTIQNEFKSNIPLLLKECKDLMDYSIEELMELSNICRLIELKKGRRVFSVDHESKYVFIIVSGLLSLRLKTNRYKELGPGNLFGEIGIFSDRGRLGTIKSLNGSTLIAIDKEGIIQEGVLSLSLRHKLTLTFIRKAISYFYDNDPISTPDLIRKGECESIEFKSSMSNKIRSKVIETIVAFMNLNGGTILVGIDDKRKIIGVSSEYTKIDQYQAHVYNDIKQRIGKAFVDLVNFDIESINNKIVLRIDIDPSRSPVFHTIRSKGEDEQEIFIVRSGCTNTYISKTSEALRFIQNNFKL